MNTNNNGRVLYSRARTAAAEAVLSAIKSRTIESETAGSLVAAFERHTARKQKANGFGYWAHEFEGNHDCCTLLSPLHLCAMIEHMQKLDCRSVIRRHGPVSLKCLIGVTLLLLAFSHYIPVGLALTIAACQSVAVFAFSISIDVGRNMALKKIVSSAEQRLYDWLDSLVAANFLSVYDPNANTWKITSLSWEKKRSGNEKYLISWALWVVFNEHRDIHCPQTSEARECFGHYHAALYRVGLADEKFDRYYAEARVLLQTFLDAEKKKESPPSEALPVRPQSSMLPD